MSGAFRRGLHYDPDLEIAILGCCLLEPASHFRILPLLETDLFYGDNNRAVCGALLDMYSKGEQIDILTVVHHFRMKGITAFGDLTVSSLMVEMTTAVVSSAHAETWAIILREMYAERQMITLQYTAGTGQGDALEKAGAIQDMLQKVFALKATDDWRDMSQVMIALDKHRVMVKGKELLGIPTGIRTLDSITAGLQKTQLIVIGARPSVGKTAFIGGIAVHAALKNNVVGVVSLEMPEEQIGARLAAVYSDMEFWRIYRNRHSDANEEQRLMDGMAGLANLPIYISDKTNVNASAIRAKAEKLKKRKGLDLLIIDYLQLIEGEGKDGNREREVAKLSRSLKLLAMDLKIPVIVLCQLNRESEKAGTNKKPRMAQIRESGAIEQDADLVMLLHRDFKSGMPMDDAGNTTEFQANIIVEKNRNGETMDIGISFNPETMKFYEPEVFDTPAFEKANTSAITGFQSRQDNTTPFDP